MANDFLVSDEKGSYWAWPWQMGKGGIRVPKFIEKMIPGWDSKDPEIRDSAHYKAGLAHTVLCSTVLAAGLTAAVGGVQYLARRRGLAESDNPAAKINSKLNTTFDPLSGITADSFEVPTPKKKKKKKYKPQDQDQTQEKQASLDKEAWELKMPPAFGMKTFFSYGIPLAAFVTALGLTDMAVDKTLGNLSANRINEKLKRRTELKNKYFTARAMNARGNLTQEQLDMLNKQLADEDIGLVKNESFLDDAEKMPLGLGAAVKLFRAGPRVARGATSAAGILATAIAMTSFIGMHQYTKAGDPDNIKYKAIRKGLNEYAKQKSNMSPINIAEPSDAYFDLIEGKKPGKEKAKEELRKRIAEASPRDQEDLGNTTFSNPVSISFD